MKEELVKMLVENAGIIISSATTLLLAFIKRKLEMSKLKKQGRLFDFPINPNHHNNN